MKIKGKGKTLSLSVKLYSVLFGTICYVAFFLLNGRLASMDECLGILVIMLGFESIVLSIDLSMVIRNIRGRE